MSKSCIMDLPGSTLADEDFSALETVARVDTTGSQIVWERPLIAGPPPVESPMATSDLSELRLIAGDELPGRRTRMAPNASDGECVVSVRPIRSEPSACGRKSHGSVSTRGSVVLRGATRALSTLVVASEGTGKDRDSFRGRRSIIRKAHRKASNRSSRSNRASDSDDVEPRLKDAPGLYKIVADTGVVAIKYLPGTNGPISHTGSFEKLRHSLSSLSVGVRQQSEWGLKRLFHRSSGMAPTRSFQAKTFVKGDLVRVTEVDHSVPNRVYGKVEEANGWIPLLDTKEDRQWADKVTVKEQVRMHLEKPVYDVTEFYKTEGVWQAIARSPIVDNLTLLVITVNAFWMWYDADENDSATLLEARPIFQIVEHLFCVYFTFEWYARFMAFEKKRNCMKDRWFMFDTALVAMMVMETWVMTAVLMVFGAGFSGGGSNASLLRLLRLLRLTRLARMLRSLQELMILIKGIVAAFRTVALAIFLLIILMYLFAIIFRQLTNDTEIGRARFRNMGAAMYTLLVNGTFLEDLYTVINELGSASFVYAGLFFTFILLSALTVMNMLIGILCEVVSNVAKVEKERMLMEFVSAKMEDIMDELDKDGDGKISKTEFRKILGNEGAVRILAETGVDVRTLIDYTDFIFESEDGNERELSLKKFMDVVLSFRSCNVATVKDAVDIRKWISKSFKKLEELTKKIHAVNARSDSSRAQDPQHQRWEVLESIQRLDTFLSALAGELALLLAVLSSAGASTSQPLGLEELSRRLHRMEATSGFLWRELQRFERCGAFWPVPATTMSIRLWNATAEEFLLSSWADGLSCLRRALVEHGRLDLEASNLQVTFSKLLQVLRHRQAGLMTIFDAVQAASLQPADSRWSNGVSETRLSTRVN